MSDMGNPRFAAEYSKKVRDLCAQYYMPTKTLPDGKPNPEYHPASVMEATNACIAMASVACIFKLLETFNPSLVLVVVADLAFGLNENSFWKQHNTNLVPVFKAALCAKLCAVMAVSQQFNDEKVVISQQNQWRSIFLVAYDCLNGIQKTIGISTAFLQDLEKAL